MADQRRAPPPLPPPVRMDLGSQLQRAFEVAPQEQIGFAKAGKGDGDDVVRRKVNV